MYVGDTFDVFNICLDVPWDSIATHLIPSIPKIGYIHLGLQTPKYVHPSWAYCVFLLLYCISLVHTSMFHDMQGSMFHDMHVHIHHTHMDVLVYEGGHNRMREVEGSTHMEVGVGKVHTFAVLRVMGGARKVGSGHDHVHGGPQKHNNTRTQEHKSNL